MKIKLTPQQSFCLAEVFAKEIVHQQLTRRLTRSTELFPNEPRFAWPRFEGSYLEVVAAIRTIPAGDERTAFVRALRFQVKRMREEKCRPATWQAYMERVRRAQQERDLPQAA